MECKKPSGKDEARQTRDKRRSQTIAGKRKKGNRKKEEEQAIKLGFLP